MDIRTAEDIYNRLCVNHKTKVEESIKKYNDVYDEYLTFIAELEASLYIRMISVNGDSHAEIKEEALKEDLKKSEEDLKNSIKIYEKIYENKDKIISTLNPIVEQKCADIKSIINGIKTGEFCVN